MKTTTAEKFNRFYNNINSNDTDHVLFAVFDRRADLKDCRICFTIDSPEVEYAEPADAEGTLKLRGINCYDIVVSYNDLKINDDEATEYWFSGTDHKDYVISI